MAARHDNVRTRKVDAFDPVPGTRTIGGYRCCACSHVSRDKRHPGDRGWAAQNRARAALRIHWNTVHYPEEAKRAIIRYFSPIETETRKDTAP